MAVCPDMTGPGVQDRHPHRIRMAYRHEDDQLLQRLPVQLLQHLHPGQLEPFCHQIVHPRSNIIVRMRNVDRDIMLDQLLHHLAGRCVGLQNEAAADK